MNREESLHRAVVQLLRRTLPDSVIWYHCPNGEYRSKRTASRLKAMGTRPGVPDLCFVLPGGKAAFIELKPEKKYLTKTQREFREDAEGLGAYHATCRSLDEVEGTLKAWGLH